MDTEILLFLAIGLVLRTKEGFVLVVKKANDRLPASTVVDIITETRCV
jgi:hypothetical protein